MAKQRKSDLPFGVNFSPSQVRLPRILELLKEQTLNRLRSEWK